LSYWPLSGFPSRHPLVISASACAPFVSARAYRTFSIPVSAFLPWYSLRCGNCDPHNQHTPSRNILFWFSLPSLRKTYSIIFATTPAPTVRPPSRTAKRKPSSMAMGYIISASTVTLSPGMHISAPPKSFSPPVTSVVRK